MPTRHSPLIPPLLALTLLACGRPGADFSVPDRTAIMQASNQYLDALVEGDWESYAGLFTADAQQLPSQGGVLDGRSEIRSYFEQMEVDFVNSESSNILVDGSGDLAYRWMDYDLTISSAAMTDTTAAAMPSAFEGRLLSVYERQDDGEWLIVADTWSPATPEAMPTETAS